MRFAALTKGCPLLLVTGFGPFPGVRLNPSATLAEAVARSPRWRLLGVEARSLVLPTTYTALGTDLEPALDGPDAILMIGLAARATRVRIERRATSRSNPLHPDAAGRSATSRSRNAEAPARRSPLAAPGIAALLGREGVRSRVSHDAGRYLCNAAYYRALGGPASVLFLHIPKPLDPGRPRRSGRRRAERRKRLERAFVGAALAVLKHARNRRRAGGGSVAALERQG